MRYAYIVTALNEVSTEDILADGSIAGLGSRNEDFIKAKPELHNEVNKYFKVNDFSKASSDCVNYLLNQYHNGGDFAANTNLYKSANTPLYQNAQNTNRALEWKPGTQAVAEGFTNFGNVLSSLFENYPNPAYEGRIIRDMFEVNKIKVPFEITNEVLGERFRFTITTNDYINIGFEGGVFNDIPPSCKSFNFKKIAGFHEAAVVNIKFEIFVLEIIGGVRFKKLIPIIFPQPVRFGVPIKFKNGSVISKGLAAELSARAIERSIKDLTSRYRNLSGTPSQIRSYFQERLKHNHREITNGGRVNFNDMSSILLTPTQYKASIWLRDDCD